MNRSCLIWFAIVPLFIIPGCVKKSGSWVKDNISQEQLRDDYEECNRPTEPIYIKDGVSKEEEATRAQHMETATNIMTLGSYMSIFGIPIMVVGTAVALANISKDDSKRCMKKKGYQRVDPKKWKRGGPEINACMREKGYEWK